jgi:hypothetical protein
MLEMHHAAQAHQQDMALAHHKAMQQAQPKGD